MKQQEYLINLKQDTAWQMHRLHFHEYIELFLMLSDGGELFSGGDIYPLHCNMLALIRSNTLHRTAAGPSDGLFERYVFHILPETVERLSTPQTNFAEILRHDSPCVQLNDEQARRLAELFESLRRPQLLGGFGWDVEQQITLLQILLLVCSLVRAEPTKTPDTNPDYDRVQPILDYIDQNYTEPLTLEDLTGQFLMSKHYLCHLFKKGTGFSVMEYVIQLRILEAQRLLREGVSVQEASDRAGFQSYAHFIRTFRNYVGDSPGRYARRFSQSDRADQNVTSR
ncbi:MAG: AraC family transcriptional regulator [Clostridiales bacterium]|nr:AraC family transcriptional regulator [Clostridiales bacterium]